MDVAGVELFAALPFHWLCIPGLQCMDSLQACLFTRCTVACFGYVRPVPVALCGQHGHHAVGGAREDTRACQGTLSPAEHGQVHEAAPGDEGKYEE